MIIQTELAAMTIVELRRFAKQNSIKIGTLTTKKDILQHILESQQKTELDGPLTNLVIHEAAGSLGDTADSPALPERRAMIITDDPEEMPAPRPARTPIAPPAGRPVQTSTGRNKPAFTLEGAKAWHNPQPFTATHPPSKYAPQLSQQGGTYTAQQAGENNAMSLRPITRVSRFGPEASAPTQTPVPAASLIPQGYRPAAYAQPGTTRYQTPQLGASMPASVLEMGRELPPVTATTGYRRQLPEFQTQTAEPQTPRPFLPLRPRDPQARELGINPAVPEMLATGDVGDGAGVLEVHPDGYGFLRAGNFLPGKSDVYVSNAQIRRFNLRSGDQIEGKTRPQREGDRYAAMLYITKINGVEADEPNPRKDFDELTPAYPHQLIRLSSSAQPDPVLRFIDLFAPIGMGQRALIVAPPKAGKTTILKKIALSIRAQHPKLQLMMLLVDERPEEVTDLKEAIGGDIFYSTFDEPAENHARASELVIERAMRLVEQGKDVVILMDSLTRLSRAYNMTAPNSARIMSGGLVAGCLNRPKRFFGAARKLQEGGSLTIIATAIVDTGSRMDDVIYEEFKGTGNMELTLDRGLQERRLFPAISIAKSGTRHEELLLTNDEMDVAGKVRAMIVGMSEQEGISLVLSMMEKTKDNDDFVARFDNWAKLMNSRR